jgi:hypothetical protein
LGFCQKTVHVLSLAILSKTPLSKTTVGVNNSKVNLK